MTGEGDSPSQPLQDQSPPGGHFGRLRAAAGGTLWGAVAGVTALGVDLALARWMLGYPLHLLWHYILAYLVTGAAFGGAVALLRPSTSAVRLWAWALFLGWMPPVIDRLAFHAGGLGLPSWAPTFLSVSAIGALLLVAVSRPGSRVPASALVLAGLASTAGLAVHRNLVDVDFSLDSLHYDAGIVVALVLVFLSLRSHGLRRLVVGLVAAVVLVLVAREIHVRPPADRVAEPPAEATNLILLVVDTLRWDVFQKVLTTTPEGEAFQARFGDAAHFDRLTAVAPWTVPSMGTILTGMYPSEHGFGRLSNKPARLRKLDEGVPTLALRLRNRGYRTFAWVANPILYPATGIDRGFDSYRMLQPATTKLPLLTLYVEWGWVDEELYQPASAVASQVMGSLDELRAAQPFFLWLHLMDPHKPYQRHELLTPEVGDEFPGEDEARYFGEVRYALGRLAEIIADFDGAGLWHDSAVVFLSDHGEMFESDHRDTGSRSRKGEPLDTGHGNGLYEELIHVPLLVKPAAGMTSPVHFDRLVSQVDLYGTFGDLLGIDLPPAGEGLRYSVVPTLEGWAGSESEPAETRPWSISGFLQHKPPQRALVGRRLKIIDFAGDRVEVFDLAEDPLEVHDLSLQRPDATAEGLELLEAYWSRLDSSEEEGDDDAVDLDQETRRRLEALGYL